MARLQVFDRAASEGVGKVHVRHAQYYTESPGGGTARTGGTAAAAAAGCRRSSGRPSRTKSPGAAHHSTSTPAGTSTTNTTCGGGGGGRGREGGQRRATALRPLPRPHGTHRAPEVKPTELLPSLIRHLWQQPGGSGTALSGRPQSLDVVAASVLS